MPPLLKQSAKPETGAITRKRLTPAARIATISLSELNLPKAKSEASSIDIAKVCTRIPGRISIVA